MFRMTALACGQAGWEFRRAGAIDPVVRANIRWLSRYRHPRCRREPAAAELLEAFAPGDAAAGRLRRSGTRSRSCRWPITCSGGVSWPATCPSCSAAPRWHGGSRRGLAVTAQAGAGQIRAGDRIVVDGRPRVVLGASGPLSGSPAMTVPSRRRRSRSWWAAAGCGCSRGDRAAIRRPDRAGRAAAGGRRAGPVVGGPHHRGRGRDASGRARRDSAAAGL